MSGPQHTPGPLGLVQSLGSSNNGTFHLYLVDASERKIAALWGQADKKMANGYLFQAAPDLLSLCRKAAGQFRFYERQHRAKGTPEADAKAEVNAALAAEIEAVIAVAEGRE